MFGHRSGDTSTEKPFTLNFNFIFELFSNFFAILQKNKIDNNFSEFELQVLSELYNINFSCLKTTKFGLRIMRFALDLNSFNKLELFKKTFPRAVRNFWLKKKKKFKINNETVYQIIINKIYNRKFVLVI